MFDADGVLFESFESNIAYYNAIFAQVGEPPLDAEEEILSISYAASDVFKLRARHNAEMLERIHGVARNLNQQPFFDLLRPPFELRPFMLELKRRYRLALATNRSATVPALVEHLNLADIFDAIASALDKVPPKPAPDILRLCMERARVTPAADRSMSATARSIAKLPRRRAWRSLVLGSASTITIASRRCTSFPMRWRKSRPPRRQRS